MAIGDPDAFGGDFGGEYSEGMDDATQSFEGPLGYAMGYGAEGANQAGDVKHGISMSVDNIPNNKTGFGIDYTLGDALIDIPLAFLTAGASFPARLGIGALTSGLRSMTGITDPSTNNPTLASVGFDSNPGTGRESDSGFNFSFGSNQKKGGEQLGSGSSLASNQSPTSKGVFETGPDRFGPQGMESPVIIRRVAEGGGMVNLRNQANALASQGRGGDTMLMHMRPDEVAGLASLGGVTRNPVTGLPEGFLLPALGAFLPGLMGIGGTGILGSALATGLGAGAGQALQSKLLGEDDPLKKGLIAGLTAGVGSAALGGLSQAIGGTPDRIVSGSQTFGPRESIDTLADAQGLDPKAFTRKFDPLTGIDTTTSLTGVSGIDSALSKGLGGLRKGAQKVTGSMLNNPISTGATLGGFGGTVAEAASMPQYSGPMPGEGTSGGSYRGSGETFQGSPLTRTGLAQQDLSQYGFGPEGMFFGEGVYAQEGGALGSLAPITDQRQALELGGGQVARSMGGKGGSPRRPMPNPFGGAGSGVQESVGQANQSLHAADQALELAGGQVDQAMGTLTGSRNSRTNLPMSVQQRIYPSREKYQQMSGGEPLDFYAKMFKEEGGVLEEESVMAEGMASLPSGGGDEVALKLTQEAVDAVRGEHPEPEIAIESFISYFGPEAFNSLRTLVIQEETARNMNGPDGLIEGDDGGRDDIQRGVIDDGVSQEELNLSGGEYIFSADDVALMGDGNTEAGARRLDEARSNLRQKARGTTQRPAYMGEGVAEEIFEEAMVG